MCSRPTADVTVTTLGPARLVAPVIPTGSVLFNELERPLSAMAAANFPIEFYEAGCGPPIRGAATGEDRHEKSSYGTFNDAGCDVWIRRKHDGRETVSGRTGHCSGRETDCEVSKEF